MEKLTKEQIEYYKEICNTLIETACGVGVPCQDALKYLLVLEESSKDYPLYTEDMKTLFDDLYSNCKEFVRAYDYYMGKREPVAKAAELPELDEDRNPM